MRFFYRYNKIILYSNEFHHTFLGISLQYVVSLKLFLTTYCIDIAVFGNYEIHL